MYLLTKCPRNKISGKSIRAIANDLKVSECMIRSVVDEDIWYKLYVMLKGQFILEVKRKLLDPCKVLTKQVKSPRDWNTLGFFSNQKKNFNPDEGVNQRSNR